MTHVTTVQLRQPSSPSLLLFFSRSSPRSCLPVDQQNLRLVVLRSAQLQSWVGLIQHQVDDTYRALHLLAKPSRG